MNMAPKQELDASGQPIIQAGDVAIAGQMAAHSIMDLPDVSGATVPPLVRFTGVTSTVTGPVDTAPYTSLLRDRLLLLTREKLRFVERQLPAFHAHKVKHSKDVAAPMEINSDADYQIVARLRGNFDDDTYLLDIEFIDIHSGEPLFNGDYRIRKEQEEAPNAATAANPQIESTEPNPTPVDVDAPPPPPQPQGNSGLQ